MRKMKKINGFLVVRFNDREKRDYPQLGNFGVIDAESYTGDIDIDRGAMEYDDADTIEVAVEQARGLDSEQDYSDEPPVYTVTVETAEGSSEETVEPQLLIRGWERMLNMQVKSKHYPGIDPRAAAHELNGYKTALRDLGLAGEDDAPVAPDHFAPGMVDGPLPREPEELLAYVCDKVCKHPDKCAGQDELDTTCAKCSVGRLMSEANDSDLRIKDAATERLDDLIQELSETQLNTRAEHLEHEARAYLEAISTTKILAEHETMAYKSALSEAVKAERRAADPSTLTPQEVRELRNLRGLLKEVDDYINGGGTPDTGSPPEVTQDTFKNTPSGIRNDRNTKKVYALGLMLAEECPDNDCRIYLNIFNIARELDAAVDMVGRDTASARVLRSALTEKAGELWQMYEKNYAVKQYKEGTKA